MAQRLALVIALHRAEDLRVRQSPSGPASASSADPRDATVVKKEIGFKFR